MSLQERWDVGGGRGLGVNSKKRGGTRETDLFLVGLLCLVEGVYGSLLILC